MNLTDLLPADPTADAVFEAFVDWTDDRGITLYPAQEEALIAACSGANVIVATPTGSGKSLVAMGAQFAALAQGRRTYYTAPIKALVSEKFFDLVEVFGAADVGMLTGDVAVNGGTLRLDVTGDDATDLDRVTATGTAALANAAPPCSAENRRSAA